MLLYKLLTTAQPAYLLPLPRRLCDCGVRLSFCAQDYWKSNEPVSIKLGFMIRPTSRKNWLSFGLDLVPDTDSGSLFHFPHHCGMGDFRGFINISHTITTRFLQYLAKWLMPTREWIHYILGGIQQKSGFKSQITFGWDSGLGRGLHSLCTV